MNSIFFDKLETRSLDQRESENLAKLKNLLFSAQKNDIHKNRIKGEIKSLVDIKNIEVFRKSDLTQKQIENPPFASLNLKPYNTFAHIYRSPGPIYDLDGYDENWWRFARALYAANFKRGDIVQNCFSYHFTPAGLMFEEAARILKCTVFPAGGENSEAQVDIMSQLKTTCFVGIPDFLRILLEKAEEKKIDLSNLKKALFSGGPLFPNVADYFKNKNIEFYQCYGTADIGLIAYEASENDGMIIDEDIILEIVRPGTGDPIKEGEVGEVVVTVLNNFELPIIRFATGDLSSFLSGESKTGRTNKRIKGWLGRADQTAKVRGMFIQPSQVNKVLINCFKSNLKGRLTISRENNRDNMILKVESDLFNSSEKINLEKKIVEEMKKIFNLRGESELVPPNSLPNDGKVIEDIRNFGEKNEN